MLSNIPIDNCLSDTSIEPCDKRLKLTTDSDIVSISSVSSHETQDTSNLNDCDSNIDDTYCHAADIILKANDVINFDIRSLLNSHIIGRAILLKYEKRKSIENKDRNMLCDIVICHFLNEGKRLNNASISILADKIIEIFEGEKKSTYFVSPIGKRKSRHNKPEAARGKLVDKHRNKLTIIRKTLGSSASRIQIKPSTCNLYYIIISLISMLAYVPFSSCNIRHLILL